MGNYVIAAVKEFFQTGEMLKAINSTSISLVPKVDCPTTVTDYRPIACCSVIYKCISKLICNKLKLVLPKVISDCQGAFVHGRNIINNILICQDLVRHYARKNAPKACLFKVDLQKAYDTIEWRFLEDLLKALNFPNHFIKVIMACVTSASFTIMINGTNHGYFTSSRGLRQGDPVSPLLFVICMEYLSRVLMYIGKKKNFKFHPRCAKLQLNHLCFADDLMVFCKGDEESAHLLIKGLKHFEDVSGLHANKTKSEVYTANVSENEVEKICQYTGFSKGHWPFKYLGTPICSKQLSKEDCATLVNKITSRIRSWQTRYLSFAGRLQLINSVLMSISTYWMQIFILPDAVVKEVNNLCRKFLWEGHVNGSKPGYVGWSKVCRPKSRGGLGIRGLNLWNTIAIGKIVWQIANKKDTLWVKWVHTVYIKGREWWDYKCSTNASWIWRSICYNKERMKAMGIRAWWPHGNQRYSIARGYKTMQRQDANVEWASIVWNRKSFPKHSFVWWLTKLQRLQVKQRLHKFGISEDDLCCCCNVEVETHQHLFHDCNAAVQVWEAVAHWLQMKICWQSMDKLIWWCKRSRRQTKLQNQVVKIVCAAVIYNIWRARNERYWQQKNQSVDSIVSRIKNFVGQRCKLVNVHKLKSSDRDWLYKLLYTGSMLPEMSD